jgi:hypothetical protein
MEAVIEMAGDRQGECNEVLEMSESSPHAGAAAEAAVVLANKAVKFKTLTKLSINPSGKTWPE